MENNIVYLNGKLATVFTYNHEMDGQRFYSATLEVVRESGRVDLIPLIASERAISRVKFKAGDYIEVQGDYRSYNRMESDKRRLILQVRAKGISICDHGISTNVNNSVRLQGHICKPPIYRSTSKGRLITDFMLAVNRYRNRTDYIPCIAWGATAQFVASCNVGDQLSLEGRIQSRDYVKRLDDDVIVSRTAYEVSCSWVDLQEVGADE